MTSPVVITEFEPAPPTTGVEIARAITAQHAVLAGALATIPTVEFFAPQGDKWSPAEHTRHLHKALRPLVKALSIPKLVLLFRFGRHRGSSVGYLAVRDRYQARLAQGYGANRFAPTPEPPPAAPDARRAAILAGWTSSSYALAREAARWSERSLDRYQLPHPLLGNLSIRDILCFTLYHNAHHLRLVMERRLALRST